MHLHLRLAPFVVAAVLATGARQASPPLPAVADRLPAGLSGTIAFQSDVAGRPAIYTLRLDTGAITRLTGDARWTETNPRWSPDGARVVFASNRAHYEGTPAEGGTPDLDLWLVNADGSGRRRLTTDAANESDPAWDADGRGVVFSSDRDSRGDLYHVALDTGVTTRLTTHYVGRAIMPAPSPAGRYIAFAAQTLRLGAFWDFQVHLLDRTTGAATPLAASAGACWPSWSHDGRRLAHVTLAPNEPSSLAIRGDERPARARAWPRRRSCGATTPSGPPTTHDSPSRSARQHHEGENWDLATIDLRTGAWARLTAGPGNDRLPDWKP